MFVSGKSWPRTRYIAKTLNPKWVGDSLALSARNITIGSHAMLWVCAMDAGKSSFRFGLFPWRKSTSFSSFPSALDLLALRDDFLGAVALNVRDLATMKQGETEKVVQVDENLCRGGRISGRIKFQIDVEVNYRMGMVAPLRMDDDVI